MQLFSTCRVKDSLIWHYDQHFQRKNLSLRNLTCIGHFLLEKSQTLWLRGFCLNQSQSFQFIEAWLSSSQNYLQQDPYRVSKQKLLRINHIQSPSLSHGLKDTRLSLSRCSQNVSFTSPSISQHQLRFIKRWGNTSGEHNGTSCPPFMKNLSPSNCLLKEFFQNSTRTHQNYKIISHTHIFLQPQRLNNPLFTVSNHPCSLKNIWQQLPSLKSKLSHHKHSLTKHKSHYHTK